MRKVWGALLIAAVLGAVVVILATGGRPSNLPLQAQFSRPWLTNEASGKPAVAMFLTNASSCRVRRWGHFGVETRQSIWYQNPQPYLGPTVILRPGQHEILVLPVPTNAGPWRAVAFLSPETWRTRVTQLPWWRNWLRRQFGGIPTEIFPTDWLEKEPPPPDQR